jgi:hypothetical protein
MQCERCQTLLEEGESYNSTDRFYAKIVIFI